MAYLEKGVKYKHVINVGRDYAIVVRRLVWKGRERIDIRLCEKKQNPNPYHSGLKYTKKGVRMDVKYASELIMALIEASDVNVHKPIARMVTK